MDDELIKSLSHRNDGIRRIRQAAFMAAVGILFRSLPDHRIPGLQCVVSAAVTQKGWKYLVTSNRPVSVSLPKVRMDG